MDSENKAYLLSFDKFCFRCFSYFISLPLPQCRNASLSRAIYVHFVVKYTENNKVYRGLTTYRQKHICVHIRTKRFYHYFDGFLMLCVQHVCVEPILSSLNPILTEFVMMLVSPPHRHPTIKAK